MKRKAQLNLEHLQKELQHERNVSDSLREMWVNSKKGLQKVSEMAEQLQRVQWKLHENEERVEELVNQLEEQRTLVKVVTAQRDRAEEEMERQRQVGSRLSWQKLPQESRAAMEHLQVEDLQAIVNVMAE